MNLLYPLFACEKDDLEEGRDVLGRFEAIAVENEYAVSDADGADGRA